jgi:hypothetical protein
MSSEALQVEMGKREEMVEGGFIPPHTKRVVTTLRPGMSGENPKTLRSPETPGKPRILRPSKVSTQENVPVNV